MASMINLVQKKNTKSEIWRYFGIKANNENIAIAGAESKPTRKTCYKDVPSKGGNTTHLFHHLQNQHPTLYNEAMKVSKKTCSSDADSNPLFWWRSNGSLFPLLSNLAKKYLSVPGTSVPSERIFSKGGIIVDPFRSRLIPDHVNTLIFLSKNIK